MTDAQRELEKIRSEVASWCEGSVTHHEWCGCQIARRLDAVIGDVEAMEHDSRLAMEEIDRLREEIGARERQLERP